MKTRTIRISGLFYPIKIGYNLIMMEIGKTQSLMFTRTEADQSKVKKGNHKVVTNYLTHGKQTLRKI